MGLSIHYSGTIRSNEMIKELASEVAEICQSLNWSFNIIDDNGDEIEGIVFSPKKSEPICLTFHTNGKLCSPFGFKNKEAYIAHGLDPELMYMCHTKTNYAGPDVHIAIVKLLRYVSQKYLENFKMYDEGLYWENNDEYATCNQFAQHNAALDSMADSLSCLERKHNETPATIADRIEKLLNEKFMTTDAKIE